MLSYIMGWGLQLKTAPTWEVTWKLRVHFPIRLGLAFPPGKNTWLPTCYGPRASKSSFSQKMSSPRGRSCCLKSHYWAQSFNSRY